MILIGCARGSQISHLAPEGITYRTDRHSLYREYSHDILLPLVVLSSIRILAPHPALTLSALEFLISPVPLTLSHSEMFTRSGPSNEYALLQQSPSSPNTGIATASTPSHIRRRNKHRLERVGKNFKPRNCIWFVTLSTAALVLVVYR